MELDLQTSKLERQSGGSRVPHPESCTETPLHSGYRCAPEKGVVR